MTVIPHTDRSREVIVDPAVEKPLLSLHAATSIDSFWRAVQRVIAALVPHCSIGLTLQHNPVVPTVTRWAGTKEGSRFAAEPLGILFQTFPNRRIVCASDLFPSWAKLTESAFYREYLEPQNCRYAVGLPFRKGQRLIGGIAIMRGADQDDFSATEMGLLRQLYPHLHTALVRLGAVERERSVLGSLEEFLNRLPLPTIVLRWDLQLIYWNGAAREFCTKWECGPGQSRWIKTDASLPSEILECCGVLRNQWEHTSSLEVPQKRAYDQLVHHPKWPFLRATISLKQLTSAVIARPHFFIECEELRGVEKSCLSDAEAGLPHLVRLTGREQRVVQLVCDGRSNQEIADETGMSLQTVKNHLYAIFHKLEVSSRSRLIALMR